MGKESKFIRVRCSKCKADQIIFGKASSRVKCTQCNGTLAEPSGGKAKIRARVEEVL
jgi:small subunit ribosomal protein S27e